MDPQQVINKSYSFLKEREPDMTETEYALYERVIPMAQTQPDFALQLLETMVADDEPESAAFEFALGNVYFTNKRNDKAEEHYKKALEAFPTFLRVWTNLGTLYYSAERFADAIPCFAKAVTLGDNDAQTLGLLGYCHYRTGNPLVAEMMYMQALTVDPDNPYWLGAIINLLVENNEFQRAEPLARKILQLKPADPANWNSYASILISAGRKIDATAVLETGSKLELVDVTAAQLLADLYLEQNLHKEALEVYRRLTDIAPSLGTPRLLGVIRAMIAADDLAQAESLLAPLKLPAGDEDRVLLFKTKAELLLAKSDWAGARRELDELLRLDPLSGWGLMALGRTYKAENDDARAEFAFSQARVVPEFAYEANLELANLSLRTNQYLKSVSFLEHALRIEHSDALQGHLRRVRSMIDNPAGTGGAN